MKHEPFISSLLAWFDAAARDLPWRNTGDPYAIWVSEIMLQQTQVKAVLPYWSRWMRALPTVDHLARARPKRIHKLWEGLGYYTRVRNMQKAARVIEQTHGGRFPEDFDDILALPGIGPYTAGAVSSIAFNQARPVVDGNIVRVLTRRFGVEGDPRNRDTSKRLWQLAEELVLGASALESESPIRSARAGRARGSRRFSGLCSRFNQSLMELGALVCTPRQPRCGACPVRTTCVALRSGRVGDFPNASPRVPITNRRFAAFVVGRGGRFLVRQRLAGVVNGQLWEFPNLELAPGGDVNGAADDVLGFKPAALHPLCTIKHSITRYRITLDVFRVMVDSGLRTAPAIGNWLYPSQLRRLPFSSAHKKILLRLPAV